jgi:hypothetical protein
VIASAFLSCLVIGLTIFFNISHVDRTKAATYAVRLVTDQVFTNEKSIPVPEIDPNPAPANAIWIKQAKSLPAVMHPVVH